MGFVCVCVFNYKEYYVNASTFEYVGKRDAFLKKTYYQTLILIWQELRYNDNSFEVKAFNSGTRKGYLLPQLLVNIAMEVLAPAIRKPNEREDIEIGKEKKKSFNSCITSLPKIPIRLRTTRHRNVNVRTNKF